MAAVDARNSSASKANLELALDILDPLVPTEHPFTYKPGAFDEPPGTVCAGLLPAAMLSPSHVFPCSVYHS